MSSSLCYFYVPAVNKEAAEKFYGSLFGWTFSPGRDNHGVKIDDVNPAGAIRGDQSAAMNSVQAFFQVENIDATINNSVNSAVWLMTSSTTARAAGTPCAVTTRVRPSTSGSPRSEVGQAPGHPASAVDLETVG